MYTVTPSFLWRACPGVSQSSLDKQSVTATYHVTSQLAMVYHITATFHVTVITGQTVTVIAISQLFHVTVMSFNSYHMSKLCHVTVPPAMSQQPRNA